jgi:hypothetical protein
VCSCIKASQWVLIKGVQHFPQDYEVRNGFKISQNPINTPLNIKKKRFEKKEKRERKKN